jgi:hypothetical protein
MTWELVLGCGQYHTWVGQKHSHFVCTALVDGYETTFMGVMEFYGKHKVHFNVHIKNFLIIDLTN